MIITEVQVLLQNESEENIKSLQDILIQHDQKLINIEAVWRLKSTKKHYMRLSFLKDAWGIFEEKLGSKTVMNFTDFYFMFKNNKPIDINIK